MRRVLILGAAGMDFHLFNILFRDNREYKVVGFTMSSEQNLGVVGKRRFYPPELAGKLYPNGIPIYPEKEMESVIKNKGVDEVVLAYSDISHVDVMHLASRALSSGADFRFIGLKHLMLKSKKPVIAICAVRTGCGKSQTSRAIAKILKDMGKRVVIIREPMPYGDLRNQVVMRFECYEDLEKNKCTIEEREEYEPYIERGFVVYSGIDYKKIMKSAEKEADVIIWDGGNNEVSFYIPEIQIVVVDPHRPGHELLYHPGEVNLRIADIIIINKVNTAKKGNIAIVKNNIKKVNPNAKIIEAESIISVERVEKRDSLKNKRVLVIEDGPTLTHGGMPYGAGMIIAKRLKCKIVDPRKNAVGSIIETYKKFPHLKNILPAMGYSEKQMKELEETINKTKCDVVFIGTPIDLGKLLNINKPTVKIRYELGIKAVEKLKRLLKRF